MQTVHKQPIRALKAQYEANQFAARYINNPELLIDDLHRTDNFWTGVMNNSPWQDRYERGFFASNFGPGSVSGRYGAGLGASGTSLTAKVYDALAVVFKAGFTATPPGAFVLSIVADGVKLDMDERRRLANEIIAANPDIAPQTARSLADIRQVMEDFATIYDDASVRARAAQWIVNYDALLKERGIASSGTATPAQLAAALPDDVIVSQEIKGAAKDATESTTDLAFQIATFNERLDKLGGDLVRQGPRVNEVQKEISDRLEQERIASEWSNYEARLEQARGFGSLMASFIASTGDSAGAQRFQILTQNSISLMKAFTKVSQAWALGELDLASMSDGVGSAVLIMQMFGPAREDPQSAMLQEALRAITKQLEAIATELHDVHIMIADLYTTSIAMRESLSASIQNLTFELNDFIEAYSDIERKRAVTAIRLLGQKLQAGSTTDIQLEAGLIEICSIALLEGSQDIHTRGIAPYESSFVPAVTALLNSSGIEQYPALLAEALHDSSDFGKLNVRWKSKPPVHDVPAAEQFDELLDVGSITCSPPLLALALQQCRAVLRAHPTHAPVSSPPATNSIDHYHRLIRAHMWMCGLYVEAREDSFIRTALVRVHALVASLVYMLSQWYSGVLRNRGGRADGLPVEFLFGLNPFVCDDWVSKCLNNLEVLIRLSLIDLVYVELRYDPFYATAQYYSGMLGAPDARRTATIAFSAVPFPHTPAGETQEYLDLVLSMTKRTAYAPDGTALSNMEIYATPVAPIFHRDWTTETMQVASDFKEVRWSTTENLERTAETAENAIPDLPGINDRAMSWARDAGVGLRSNDINNSVNKTITEIKRATVHSVALLKNKYSGIDMHGLPPSLRHIVAAAGENFYLDDTSRHFYGDSLLNLFLSKQSPVPTKRNGVTSVYWIDELTRLRRVLDASTGEEEKRKLWQEAEHEIDAYFSTPDLADIRARGLAGSASATNALPSMKSSANFSPLRNELQYQIAQTLLTSGEDDRLL